MTGEHRTRLALFQEEFHLGLETFHKTAFINLKVTILDHLRDSIDLLPESIRISYLTELNVAQELMFHQALWAGESFDGIDPQVLERGLEHCDLPGGQQGRILSAIGERYLHLQHYEGLIRIQNKMGQLIAKREYFCRTGWFRDVQWEKQNPVSRESLRLRYVPKLNSLKNACSGSFISSLGPYSVGVTAKIIMENVQVSRQIPFDQFRISTHLIDENDIASTQSKIILKNLREMLKLPAEKHIRLEFAIDQPSSLLTGCSSGVAFQILGFLGLQQIAPRMVKRSPLINQGIAMTGAIDRDNQIHPVDEASLLLKLQAAFFGKSSAFAVPASQFKSANSELESLQLRYPLRKFSLLPLGCFDDILDADTGILAQKKSFLGHFHGIREKASDIQKGINSLFDSKNESYSQGVEDQVSGKFRPEASLEYQKAGN